MEGPRNIVGPQVMRLRNAKGLSQADLATACQLGGWDVSRGAIARIEGCVRWVSDGELLELARVLKVPVQQLYPEEKRRFFVEPSPQSNA